MATASGCICKPSLLGANNHDAGSELPEILPQQYAGVVPDVHPSRLAQANPAASVVPDMPGLSLLEIMGTDYQQTQSCTKPTPERVEVSPAAREAVLRYAVEFVSMRMFTSNAVRINEVVAKIRRHRAGRACDIDELKAAIWQCHLFDVTDDEENGPQVGIRLAGDQDVEIRRRQALKATPKTAPLLESENLGINTLGDIVERIRWYLEARHHIKIFCNALPVFLLPKTDLAILAESCKGTKGYTNGVEGLTKRVNVGLADGALVRVWYGVAWVAIQDDLDDVALARVLAHEMGHVAIITNQLPMDALPTEIEEGIAELISALWCRHTSDVHRAESRSHRCGVRRMNPNGVYRRGLLTACFARREQQWKLQSSTQKPWMLSDLLTEAKRPENIWIVKQNDANLDSDLERE